MRRRNVLPVSLAILSVLSVGALYEAHAVATYEASINFNLNFPGAITNTFGFAGPVCAFNSDLAVFGNAGAATGDGTCTRTLMRPPSGQNPIPPNWPGSDATASVNLNVQVPTGALGADVTGFAGPGAGLSAAFSDAVAGANLGNLTGSGGPTGPPRFLEAPFSGSYSYDLITTIMNPALEAAEAEVQISVRVGGVAPVGWVDVMDICTNNCNHSRGPVPFMFTALLAANSVTPLELRFTAEGEAISFFFPPPPPVVPPPPIPRDPLPYPIPEPSTFLMITSGLVGLIVWRTQSKRHHSNKSVGDRK